MVETKTAKRKAAAKTAARTAAEIHNASVAVKKTKVTTSESPSNPTATRLRPRQGSKDQNTSEETCGQPGVPRTQRKKRAADPVDEASMPRADEDAESEEEELGGQRLVVKLEKKQEKALELGLKKLEGARPPASGKSGVVYLGRIPFGFFEKQMRDYFAQFGDVKRIRMSRNKKTGKPKHFAFIEFEHPEVADIVAQTHDNMLICDRMVKCNVVPVEKIHATMFKGADEEFKAHPWKKMARDEANRKRSVEEEQARLKNLVAKERKRKDKLKALGVEYDFDGFEALVDQRKPKRTKLD